MSQRGPLFGDRSEGTVDGRIGPGAKPVVRAKSGRSEGSTTQARRPAKARGLAGRERPPLADVRGAESGDVGQIGERDGLLESYLRGLADHRNNLREYLSELEWEREELERERGDLALKIEANQEKRERVAGYLEEVPQLRDKMLRSLVRGMEGPEDG